MKLSPAATGCPRATLCRQPSRRTMLRGGLAAAVALVLAGLLRGTRAVVGPSAGTRWYELVEDMWQAGKWHVNLYSGPAPWDLARGKLERRWVESGVSLAELQEGLEFPWRAQRRDGPQEQNV